MALILTGVGQQDADAMFGPQLLDNFDFTLLFEHTILGILPNVVCVIGSIVCIYQLSRKAGLVSRGMLWWLKLISTVLLLATEICALALWSLPETRTRAALAAASASCVASFFVIILADAEHRQSLHSSGFLNLYLGLYTLLCIAKARSLFLRPEVLPLAILQIISIGLMILLLVLGEISKTSEIIDPDQRDKAGPEAVAGFWNRSLYIWLLPTLHTGCSRLLDSHDLRDLAADLQGGPLFSRFVPIWSRYSKGPSNVLFRALVRTMLRSIVLAMVPRLSLIGFSFAQPYLLERVVSLLESNAPRNDSENGLIGAAALIYIGIMVSRAWYSYLLVRVAAKTRGILVSAIFHKSLRLEHHKAKKLAAVTLMSTDADGVSLSVRKFFELIANLLELAVGIALLATKVGPACVMLLVPTAFLSVFSAALGKKVAPAQIAWNKSIETRVSRTSAILRQIRSIKMVGQGPAATHYIQELRKSETEESRKYRFLQAMIFANAMLIYCLTPISVMAGSIFWTRAGDVLKPSEVFTILSIVAIVSTPLSKVVACYPKIAATLGRLKRIQSFLQLDERCDQRRFIEPSTQSIAEAVGEGSKGIEAEKLHRPGRQNRQSWDVHPVEALRVDIAATRTSGIVVNSSSFWIPRRKLTMVVGKTGCGKSTLLRGLLGEAVLSGGKISLEREFVAYCDQETWIQNISIRETVVGACKYDARWYGNVVRFCQLLRDIQALPLGDETIVGSDGLKLSGGQKARLALARAVYALAPTILLDDIFSSLDEPTADAIFDELLGPYGVLRNTECAVVLATSSGKYIQAQIRLFIYLFNSILGRYLPWADHLLYLNGNRSVVHVTNSDQIPGYARFLDEEPIYDGLEAGQAQMAAPEAQTEQPSPSSETDQTTLFRQHGDANLYLMYFKVIPMKLLIFWLVLLGIFALSERSPEIYMRIWLATFPTNKLFFVGYGLLGVVCGMFGLSQIYASYGFATSVDAGVLLNRFSGDMTVLGQELPQSVALVLYGSSKQVEPSYQVLTFQDILMLTIDIGIISSGAKYMAAAVPFLFAALFMLQKFYLRTSRQLRFMDLEAKSPLYTHFTETTRGLLHIRGFQWEASFIAKFYKLLNNSQKPIYHLSAIQQWLTAAMDAISVILCVALVALASRFHDSSPSGTGLALLNLITFGEQLTFLMSDWTELETSLGAIARLDQFITNTPVEKDADDVAPISASWPENGTIEFRGVDAGYSRREGGRLVLSQLSLRVPGGSKLGIVGHTGCGPLLIDGIDITKVPRQLLRTRITTISQDFFELPGTLRDNLLPPEIMRPKDADRRLDDDAIYNVLLVAGLHDIVNERGGLNAPFDELGFSHGERQLVALARGIIHTLEFRTKIVLLDEVTGALDQDTRTAIQATLNGYFANHTVLTITHRMDMLRDVNKVYDMNENRVYQ
ncbi:hypothetical protein LLEC1_03283 [Akanthomyces lecanii]|uniref:ABC transporter domain-containing protein n=1 Tax=Cordyceps confragosa TaxID=2714763 RepID=A0A179IG80_CORDF|nr:hypothetical protein LLEC1_03283 [Akanthomyces lecanii]